MKLPYDDVHLIADPLYGYLRITLSRAGEIAEADVIDSPWVQRLKRIHQLQSSWWVFPTAEHSRFAHSLGVMHLAGLLAQTVYPTLREVEPATPVAAAGRRDDAPRRPAARRRPRALQPLLRRGVLPARLRARPRAHLAAPHRQRDGRADRGPCGAARAGRSPRARRSTRGTSPFSCAPRRGTGRRRRRRAPPPDPPPDRAADPIPRWVRLLHRALSGAVTVDNLDYVRRDAYMCGVSVGSVDPERLIYYTFCTADGLTFHKRALSALRAFLNARFYMYENVYFHRVGHAIDIHLREIFRPTMSLILPRSPLEDLDAYRRVTEWSLFTTVEEWLDEPLASEKRELAEEWQSIIHRHVKYSMVYEQAVELQRPAPATRELTPAEFHAAVVRHLPEAREGPRVRRRHRLAGPAPAQPAERAEAHPGLRPGDGAHRGAAAHGDPRVRAGQGAPVPRLRRGARARPRPRRRRQGGAGRGRPGEPHEPVGRRSASGAPRPAPAAGYSAAGASCPPARTQASNSSALMQPRSSAASRSVRPSRCACWAICAAFS